MCILNIYIYIGLTRTPKSISCASVTVYWVLELYFRVKLL